GGQLLVDLKDHLQYLRSSLPYLSRFDPYAALVTVPAGLHVFNLAAVALLLWLVKGSRTVEVQWILIYTVLAIVPLFLMYGWRDEIRVFAPAFPALFLLVADCLT